MEACCQSVTQLPVASLLFLANRVALLYTGNAQNLPFHGYPGNRFSPSVQGTHVQVARVGAANLQRYLLSGKLPSTAKIKQITTCQRCLSKRRVTPRNVDSFLQVIRNLAYYLQQIDFKQHVQQASYVGVSTADYLAFE